MEPELIPIRSGNPTRTGDVALEQNRVLRNTYLLLGLTMVPTVIGAVIGISTGGIIMQHPIISLFVMLGAVIGLQVGIAHYRNSAIGVVLLLLMTFLLGWWLGPLLAIALTLKNGPQLVGIAAGGTGAIFFVMAGIATTTKRDFSFMGKFLFVGMIVALLAIFANFYLQIPALALTISAVVVVVFSLFLLYHVSRIVTGGETNYIMAATGCYLALINIFASLLQLLMALTGERD
jgi:modulator of FtsH protease